MATKDASITVRIPKDLKDTLDALAKREDRTLSKVVERFLRDAVEPKPKRSR